MDPGPLVAIAAIGAGLGWGWIGLQYRKLDHTAKLAIADADEQRTEKQRLAERVAVLERIVTDKGYETAESIAALDRVDREKI